MAKSSVKNTVNFAKAKRQAAKAEYNSLAHAAASLRKITLNSLRNGLKKDGGRVPSKPGAKPKVWSNRSGRFMKRNILFSQPERIGNGVYSASVYARPEEAGNSVFQMHELGGVQTVTVTKIVDERKRRFDTQNGIVQERDLQQGWFGKYKKTELHNRKYRSFADRSNAEVKAIQDYYDNMRTKKVKIRLRAKYKKRPFLTPALEKIKQRLPKQCAAEMQQQLH
jgi:hypothetical protein